MFDPTILYVILIISLAALPLQMLSNWGILRKLGESGWKGLVPIYNTIVLLRLLGKPWWWILLLSISPINIIFSIWMLNLLSKKFGKEEDFTVLLVLFGIPVKLYLAFGSIRPIDSENRGNENEEKDRNWLIWGLLLLVLSPVLDHLTGIIIYMLIDRTGDTNQIVMEYYKLSGGTIVRVIYFMLYYLRVVGMGLLISGLRKRIIGGILLGVVYVEYLLVVLRMVVPEWYYESFLRFL